MHEPIPASLPTLLACALLAFPALAVQEERSEHVPTYVAVRTPNPPSIDGRADDVAWQAAPAFGAFRQRDPEEGQPASEATQVRVAYDDSALYVLLVMHDREPGEIVKRLARRDAEADADLVRVYLDPAHDHKTGAYFEVSAAGVQGDAILFNDSWDDRSWDGVWDSAVSRDEQGWTAELRLPLSELRFPAAPEHVFGINVMRRLQRRNEQSWLELVPKKQDGLASRMAHLTGLAGLQPRRHLALQPYVVARGDQVAPAGPGDPFNDGSQQSLQLGLDVKYGLTSSLTLDATLNPDFGQVEVDPAVVNLSDSETYFEEKRPFFIEGSDLLGSFARSGSNNFWGFNRSDPQLYYSRRIGRNPQGSADGEYVDTPAGTTILGAAKLSGRTADGWSLGLLDALTGQESARVSSGGPVERVAVEPLSNYVAARAERGLARGGLGAIFTAVNRRLDGLALDDLLVGQAYVLGLDGHWFLDGKKDWVLVGGLAGSRVAGSSSALDELQRASQHYFQRPDATHVALDPARQSLSGWTGNANLNRQSGRFRVNTALWGTSPGFESNDLGFNWKSDRWGGHVVGEWRRTDPGRHVRSAFVAVAKWYSLNFAGDRQGDGLHVFSNAQLRNYWRVGGNAFTRWATWDDSRTRGGPSMRRPGSRGADLWFESDSRRSAKLRGEVFVGDYQAAGDELFTTLTLELRPSSGLSFTVGPQWSRVRSGAQWVDGFDDPQATATYARRYVFADLRQDELAMTLRANWIVSPRLSLQVYAQPLVSVGEYGGYKELARPRSFDFLRYGSDAGTIAYDQAAGAYTVDPDGAGPAAAFSFERPDFNFKSLRVNAVLRWEWRPGSTLYVAWTQQRQNEANPGQLELGRDVDDLLHAPADDIFLVKFAWRLGR